MYNSLHYTCLHILICLPSPLLKPSIVIYRFVLQFWTASPTFILAGLDECDFGRSWRDVGRNWSSIWAWGNAPLTGITMVPPSGAAAALVSSASASTRSSCPWWSLIIILLSVVLFLSLWHSLSVSPSTYRNLHLPLSADSLSRQYINISTRWKRLTF